MTKVDIYADGSSRGNPGRGGYGCVIRYVDSKGETHIREFSQGYTETTNNRMELMGVIVGIEALIKPCEITLTSDSKYVIDSFNKNWVYGWRKRGWKKGSGEKVKNIDLWTRLLKAIEDGGHNVKFVWIKGHNGHPMNERCDQLATEAADGDDLIEDTEYGGN
jgi:ribonuclease HI